MSSVAARVLEEAARAESQAAQTSVEKPLALELDLGNMLALDNNQLEPSQLDVYLPLLHKKLDSFIEKENLASMISNIESLMK